jgi:hypothetical protein
MPFKMMNPLKKMDTTAMKTVQKSAMKLKDLNNDGETTKADLLIKKGVYNKDGSPKKKASGVNYMNESKSPAKVTGFGAVGAVIKDTLDKNQGKGKYLSEEGLSKYEINLLKEGISKGASKGLKENYNKAKEKQDAYNKKMSETGATSGGTGEAVVTAGSGSKTEGGTSALNPENKKESSTTTTTNTTGKKTTYSQAWDKMTDAAQKKYKSKEEFIKAAKAYNVKIGKTKEEKKTVISVPEKKGIEVANKEAELNQTRAAAEKAEAGFQKEQAAKKKAAAEKKAAEEAKKNKKLTPKEKRKAERNIKAQEKANKKIRKGGGTEIEVDKKNTTATAADRRKLKQGAKRLEQKLSLAQKEIDRKNKKKKEDKKGKDKKGEDNTSKTSKSFI